MYNVIKQNREEFIMCVCKGMNYLFVSCLTSSSNYLEGTMSVEKFRGPRSWAWEVKKKSQRPNLTGMTVEGEL